MPPRETLYVVADGDEIRGGAFLREFPFRLGDRTALVGSVKYPLSESLLEKRFAGVPAALLLHLMRQQPHLMAVGMGGEDGPFAQLLLRLGWRAGYIGSFLCPLRPHAVLKALPHIQREPRLRRVARLMEWSGAARALSTLAPALLRLRTRGSNRLTTRAIPAFPEELRSLATIPLDGYKAGMLRSPEVLNWMYPVGEPSIRRFVVEWNGRPCGWYAYQVVDLRPLGNRAQFGPLLMGFVIESYAEPEHAGAIARLLVRAGLDEGVDLMLANHSHALWHRALLQAGFFRGPRRFGYFRSPGLEKLLMAGGFGEEDLWVTRGDDGYYTL